MTSRVGKGTAAQSAKHRVLHLIDTGGPGGAETVFLNLVSRLPADRWSSLAVVPWANDWLHRRLLEEGLQPEVVTSRGSFDFRYLNALRRLVSRFRPDLIQTHLLTTAVYGSVAGRLTGRPTVSTFHGRVDALPSVRFRGLKLGLVDRPRGREIFVSDALRSWFLSTSTLTPDRARVVPNGIELDRFGDRGDRVEWRRRLGVHDNTVLIGAVGNIRSAKDYPTLLRAASLVDEAAERPVAFVIAGQGGGVLRRELEELHGRLDLGNRLRFLGFVADVPSLLGALDLFVLSSTAEGFSLSTVEAMGSGLAVVATRSGGPEEIVENGVTGRLVDPADPMALAGVLEELARDPEERRRLGVAARASVRRRFSMAAMIRGYEAVYEELLGTAGTVSAALADTADSLGAREG